MKRTRLIMGMPITIWATDPPHDIDGILDDAYALLDDIDRTFSTYKSDSQISRINDGTLVIAHANADVQEVLHTCERLRKQMLGYFDAHFKSDELDPSGYVKGWAIKRVGELLEKRGLSDFCIDAGGDIMFRGDSEDNAPGWITGIASPFDDTKIVKTLRLKDMAIATSGMAIRGQHIFNPHTRKPATALASVSVVGPDICLCDVLATTVFAMGDHYESLLPRVLPDEYDVYVVNDQSQANFTSGFSRYVLD